MSSGLEIRAAEPGELPLVGRLTLDAYLHDFDVNEGYRPDLLDAASRSRDAELLVAVRDGVVVGTVTFVPSGGPWAEVSGPGESEFRMLAVDPAARGQGVAEALVREVVERSRALRRSRVVLSSSGHMHVAHRLYERLGFVRAPELDWTPVPGVDLVAYVLPL